LFLWDWVAFGIAIDEPLGYSDVTDLFFVGHISVPKRKFHAKSSIPIAKSHSTLNEGTDRSFRFSHVNWPPNEIGKMYNRRQLDCNLSARWRLQVSI
jgi:hypothetical protein